MICPEPVEPVALFTSYSFVSTLSAIEKRWLTFCEHASQVFQAYPEAIPLRYTIFKTFVQRQTRATLKDYLKDLARFGLRQRRSRGAIAPVDMVLWIAHPRDIYLEPMLAVASHLDALGVRYVFAGSSQAVLPIPNARNTVVFEAPYRYGRPKQWSNIWMALCAVEPGLSPASREAFLLMGRGAESYERDMESLLAQLRPSMLCTAADHMLPASVACHVANSMGIPSVTLMHGAVIAYDAPLTAAYMGVWGEMSRCAMLELGVPDKQLAVLGSPRHDRLPRLADTSAREDLTRRLGVDEKPCFVFFSNGNDPSRNGKDVLETCVVWLDQAAHKLRGQAHVLVRLHPNEDGMLYSRAKSLIVFKHECDLATTLAGADTVGSLCSTALLEGVLYGKPTLQFLADGWPELVANWRWGLAERAESSESLSTILPRALFDREYWEHLVTRQNRAMPWAFANYRNSAQATAEFLVSLAEQSARSSK